MEDCNVAYNDTLDAVVDEVEGYIANGMLKSGDISEKQKVRLIHLQMVRDGEVAYNGGSMKNPAEAAQLVKSFLGEADRECLVVCATDIKMKPTYMQTVSIGASDFCPVSIPEIFKMALLSNASNIILFHNHPSGDCTPSRDDVECTERVIGAGKLLGIRLLDHIILGNGNDFYSMRESDRVLLWESVC